MRKIKKKLHYLLLGLQPNAQQDGAPDTETEKHTDTDSHLAAHRSLSEGNSRRVARGCWAAGRLVIGAHAYFALAQRALEAFLVVLGPCRCYLPPLYLFACVCVCVCVCTGVSIFVCIYTRVCVCVCVCVCVQLCVYVCMYVCMYACMCRHTDTHTPVWAESRLCNGAET